MTNSSKSAVPPQVLDVFELARTGDKLEGAAPLAAFPRVAESAQDAGAEVQWHASGHLETVHGQSQAKILRIHAETRVLLKCQRCLETIEFPIHVQARLEVVEDAKLAENADLEDEEVDVVLGSQRFNLLWQIEEEMLLALPYAPRHEECEPLDLGEEPAEEEKPSPFAVLAQLKKKH
jgi:uncharacterized protein